MPLIHHLPARRKSLNRRQALFDGLYRAYVAKRSAGPEDAQFSMTITEHDAAKLPLQCASCYVVSADVEYVV